MRRTWTRSLLTAGLTLLLLTSCATVIEGAREPPHEWLANYAGSQCDVLSGTYAETGEPAPANSNAWLYGTVWPVVGSLSSIVQLGANAPPVENDTSVKITMSADGKAAFEGRNAAGAIRPLVSRQWECDKGALVSRVTLGDVAANEASKRHPEAYLRLWKTADGALIAEQTIRSVKSSTLSDSSEHRPLARFYFHFSART